MCCYEYYCDAAKKNQCYWGFGTYFRGKMRKSWRDLWLLNQTREENEFEDPITSLYNGNLAEEVSFVVSPLSVSFLCKIEVSFICAFPCHLLLFGAIRVHPFLCQALSRLEIEKLDYLC